MTTTACETHDAVSQPGPARPTRSEFSAAPGPPAGASGLLGEHGALLSVGLHVLPGVLTGAVFFALRPLIVSAGYPPHLALVLAVPLALLPVTLGSLLYLGHRRNGHLSLKGVVLYSERISFGNYLAYVPTVFVAGLTIFAIGGMVLDEPLRAALFGWMPSLDWGLGSSYSRGVLVVTFALAALFVLFLESTVEEIYFRGFLLPRMGYAGRWAVPLHSLLFALYHLWMPWRIVSLAIGILPLVFAVRRTRNIYVGIIPHMLFNSWDVMVGVAFILAMTSTTVR
jgi:membrane protease YdiL (CAAX protease family)